MMPPHLSETAFSVDFRREDAQRLGEHLAMRHSVEIVGIKRVGISSFLRFFLYHKDIVPTYISKTEKHLFIPVDLNDLAERELQPFWILVLKRLCDAAEQTDLDTTTKEKITSFFLQSIQLQDNFLTNENIKNVLLLYINHGYLPTLFLLRFDRMKEAATPEFFSNIQSLIDTCNQQLAIVFTTVRPLDEIRPDVFIRKELTTFSHQMYIRPANEKDSEIVVRSLEDKYHTNYSDAVREGVIKFAGGHMQYLYLSQIILFEKLNHTHTTATTKEIEERLKKDERIHLQSEEIFESLTKAEQDAVKRFVQGKKVSVTADTKYLFDAGVLKDDGLFSPLFNSFVTAHANNHESVEFSKKELHLYSLLLENKDEICERDTIIHAVWPEYEEMGVSDWTIDRLVARLRQKLTLQKSPYSVVTVKTRGYKLVQS